MFEPGVKYMFDEGMLYIEDMEAKKELGIEPEDAKEPVNVIILNDKQRRQYWVNLSLNDFKKKVDELPREQVELLADYAIENRLVDVDKCDFMQEKCGRDIMTAIKLNKADEEGRKE
jgi:5-formaminoimidazole-4-carboxamide-1-beta-D-ribofuranosyl 5'-monophosphate synthetase